MQWLLKVLLLVVNFGDASAQSAAAAAQYSPASLRRLHADIDDDSDGKVSIDEILSFAKTSAKAIAQQSSASALSDFDKNGDGYLTLWEHLSSAHGGFFTVNEDYDNDEDYKRKRLSDKKLQTDLFAAADENGDGRISPDESTALYYPNREWNEDTATVAAKSTIAARDTDEDGMLSAKELFDIDDLENIDLSPFKLVDTDGDGYLNLEEVLTYETGHHVLQKDMQDMFEIADQDLDGKLSAQEIAQGNWHKSDLNAPRILGSWLAQSGYEEPDL
mmetsp:Transcript_64672/g.122676  ORF Transcript_64672/g.122676 Transcript_64672/m.122676 type:complete len:275 (-) Transcript_64672:33-857(-)